MNKSSIKRIKIAWTVLMVIGLGGLFRESLAGAQSQSSNPSAPAGSSQQKPGTPAQPPGTPAQKQPGTPGQPAQPQPAYTKEEYDAYQKVESTQDPKARVEAAEEFLKKYPKSTLGVHVHRAALGPYQQMGNAEKIIEHGEAILEANPTDVGVASLLAYVYAERESMNKAYREKALQLAQKALEQINTMQKPATVNDADWDKAKRELQFMNYSTEGLVYLKIGSDAKDKEERTKQLTQSVDLLKKALDLNKMDDRSWYYLGMAYREQNKGDETVNALAKCVAVNGPVKQYCQSSLEEVYKKLHKNSTDGLADVIKKAGEELGVK